MDPARRLEGALGQPFDAGEETIGAEGPACRFGARKRASTQAKRFANSDTTRRACACGHVGSDVAVD